MITPAATNIHFTLIQITSQPVAEINLEYIVNPIFIQDIAIPYSDYSVRLLYKAII